MIRLIQRRLIIPRGDSGSFSIPLTAEVQEGDVAIFALYDPLTKKTALKKKVIFENSDTHYITFNFSRDDTIQLEPKKYNWDVTLYYGPEYDEDDELINAQGVDSYYAAYSLPICEIREVTTDG